MKSILTLFLIVCVGLGASKGQLLVSEKAELDSLIELALTNSHVIKNINEKIKQQKQQLHIEKLSWISGIDVGLQFFSLEQQVGQENDQVIYSGNVLPQVGGSLRLSLHKLATTPQRIKIAREEVNRTEENKLGTMNDIEQWVTLKYYEYVQAKRQAALAKNLLVSQEQSFELIREKFERNEAKLEDFLKVQNALQLTKETIIKHELNIEKFKAELSIITK